MTLLLMASEQTKQIIDVAFQEHINSVFTRLCSSTEANNVQRFVASWRDAVAFRAAVLEKVQ